MDNTQETEAPFRFKLLPVIATVILGLGLPYAAAYAAEAASKLWGLPSIHGPTLPWLYSQHAFQLVFALVAIFILKRFIRRNYGLRLPKGKTYIGAAIFWGAFFGVLMTVIDYAPQLLSHKVPDPGFAMTKGNVAGWLFFEGVYVGPTEEIPFRSLLVTFLAATMPGKLHIGRFNMNWAGIIVAVIFALAHATNFLTEAWPLALGQQLYAFALGVFYAYWLEKSGSIVASIIGHNVSDFSEYLLLFLWIWLA